MATFSKSIRQGLPRVPGGPAWPDVDGAVQGEALAASPPAAQEAAPQVAVETAHAEASVPGAASADVAAVSPAEAGNIAPAAPAMTPGATGAVAGAALDVALRQGLPRTPGGDPWPPAGTVQVVGAPASAGDGASAAQAAALPTDSAADLGRPEATPAPQEVTPEATSPTQSAPATPAATRSEEVTLRQGLPRTPGGEPWPAAQTVTVERAIAEPATASVTAHDAPPESASTPPSALEAPAAPARATVDSETSVAEHSSSEPVPATVATPAAQATPAGTAPAKAASPQKPVTPKREPIMLGSRTLGQWIKLAVLWGGGAVVAAGIIVLAARGVTTLPGVPEFMARYPGEYPLPEFVDPGFPAWVRWTHFLNFFMMVMIIRSGLLVRQQQKPDAFFTPKKGGKKISIYLWLHTSIDVLWVVNGLAFVVLMFITGHWARIVPTSWEVFPNALSAMLQYLTLEWPIEDGWVNYNSLQQIMYFTVVFIAAPLAIITGVRMSEWWPANAEKLNKFYPAPVARAIHFPTMLFFVLFILIHVFLVFTTGALKNLNHMFVGTPEISWLGFWLFVLGLLVTAAVTWAARPLVLAPVANLFGRVSER